MALPPQNPRLSPEASFLAHTPERIYSASQFSSQSEFYDHIRNAILTDTHHEEIIYREVPKDSAGGVFEHIEKETEHTCARKNYNSVTGTLWVRKMPTWIIHDCHQEWVIGQTSDWLQSGLLTKDEFRYLGHYIGTTIKFSHGPYKDSRKEPDFLLIPDNHTLPVFVIESGWSDSLPRLRDDMNLWLVGGNGDVKATLILKWQMVGTTERIVGSAELYTLDANGIPILRQEETIFPTPAPEQAQAQVISLTRRTLFGSNVFPERNPKDVLTLSIDDLRVAATKVLARMGLNPA